MGEGGAGLALRKTEAIEASGVTLVRVSQWGP